MADIEEHTEVSELEEEFMSICRELELSPAKSDIAWRGFQAVRRQCLIEVSKMENSFAVSTVLYDRFAFIFSKVFVGGEKKKRTSGRKRAKKIRVESGNGDFNLDSLKSFCWILYSTIRKHVNGTSDNVILGYCFLLCMFDTIIHNLAESDRKHMLDQDICEMLRGMDFIQAFSNYCDVSVLDVKFIRAEWWTPRVKLLIEDHVLTANAVTLLGLLDHDNFTDNLNSINDMYLQMLLRRGDLDERVFLDPVVRMQILPELGNDYEIVESSIDDHDSTDEEFNDRLKEGDCPTTDPITLTPLTYDYSKDSPAAKAFGGSIVEMSRSTNPEIIRQSTNISNVDSLNYFLQITFAQVAPNPLTYIFDITKRLGDLYVSEVIKVESIVQDEFVRSLYGNCIEVVHFSYNPTRLFPWALDHVIKLGAFNYFKMIEIIIKIEPEFSREMIKQLNRIEERVLEELAWVEGSVFWLYKEGFTIPSALEVCHKIAYYLINLSTPRITHYYRPKRGQIPVFSHRDGPSQRFSVNQGTPPKSACRRLNLDNVSSCIRLNTTCQGKGSADSVIKISSISLPRGKLIPKSPVKLEASTTTTTNTLVLSKKSPEGAVTGRTVMLLGTVTRSIMTLFIKKVYHLAAVRLNYLCERFRASEPVKLQTWALFERIVMTHTEIFKGRHVDQIIICCLFLTTKVSVMRREVSFRDILFCYRFQPQAHSDIYRQVLMDPVTKKGENDQGDPDSIEHSIEKVYDDITRFYNVIFYPLVEEDIKAMFTPETDKHSNTPSSPIPSLKTSGSFRKAISKGIYLSPLKPAGSPGGTIRPIRYSVERSPVKELRAINNVVETTADRINERTMSTHVGLARVPSCRRMLFGPYRGGTSQNNAHQQVHRKIQQFHVGGVKQ
ncbi:DUF3452 and RB B and RB A domain containing prote in [Trichuris trichiura]|uniref:DUF3452 and RB B and RB A domain containing prote in n=1 Tax=Trichuris trichiura TaxID=36087 RepID=A0A077YY55_TRITR|nr:DUF3452 and RB B and RB A domain containing prote in [Trichuris trichiura]